MGWKKPWWQSIACPGDVENEQEFRQGTSLVCTTCLVLCTTFAAVMLLHAVRPAAVCVSVLLCCCML